MSLDEEIRKAIGTHGLWKSRLLSAIETGKSDFQPDHVCKDHLCEFGKWLYGPSLPATVKQSPDYEACRKLHADFHQVAADVLRYAVTGQKQKAIDAMGHRSRYADVSAQLTSAMSRWKASAAHHAGVLSPAGA